MFTSNTQCDVLFHEFVEDQLKHGSGDDQLLWSLEHHCLLQLLHQWHQPEQNNSHRTLHCWGHLWHHSDITVTSQWHHSDIRHVNRRAQRTNSEPLQVSNNNNNSDKVSPAHKLQYTQYYKQVTVHRWPYTGDSTEVTVQRWPYTGDCTEVTVQRWPYTGDSTQVTVERWQYTGDSTEVTVHRWQYRGDSTEVTVQRWQYTGDCREVTVHRWL